MKKIKSILLILIVLLLVGCTNFNKKDPPPQVITNKISGSITNISANSISIKYSDKNYTFSLISYKGKNTLPTLFIGDSITLSFDGEVTSNKSFQDNANINAIIIDKYADFDVGSKYDTTGIFSDYYNIAYRKLLTMTIDEKIGQVLLARLPEDKQIETIAKYNLSGYIMFGRDFTNKTKQDIISTTTSFQQNSKIPMIIAVDEEGGDVVRVSSNPNLAGERFKSSQELYNSGGFDLIKQDTINKSNLLISYGINMNLAPVVDVSTDPTDYIYDRSFGKNAKLTEEYVKTVIEASKQGKVSYVLKHFPGYGNNVDTHTGIAIDERNIENFRANDFLPFEQGISSGVTAILVSHNIVKCIDDKNPASLSIAWHDLLRNELKFTGIIITDDLAMDAIKNYVTVSPEVAALLAKNDLLIVTDYKTAYQNIKTAIDDKTLSEETLNEAVLKTLAFKYYAGLLPNN